MSIRKGQIIRQHEAELTAQAQVQQTERQAINKKLDQLSVN